MECCGSPWAGCGRNAIGRNHLPAANRRVRSVLQRRTGEGQFRAGGSAAGGEIAEAAGHLAHPYDVSLRLEQRLRRAQPVSLRWGVAEYLLDIGGGEVGLTGSVGLLFPWLVPYG